MWGAQGRARDPPEVCMEQEAETGTQMPQWVMWVLLPHQAFLTCGWGSPGPHPWTLVPRISMKSCRQMLFPSRVVSVAMERPRV